MRFDHAEATLVISTASVYSTATMGAHRHQKRRKLGVSEASSQVLKAQVLPLSKVVAVATIDPSCTTCYHALNTTHGPLIVCARFGIIYCDQALHCGTNLYQMCLTYLHHLLSNVYRLANLDATDALSYQVSHPNASTISPSFCPLSQRMEHQPQ